MHLLEEVFEVHSWQLFAGLQGLDLRLTNLRVVKKCLLLSLLILGGCSGDSSEVTPGVTSLPAPPTQARTLSGRVFLGGTAAADVRLQALDGRELGRVQAPGNGPFLLRNQSLPADFRVVALVGGAEFRQEVRGYRGGNLYVAPNVPTTLASALGGSLPEAETTVRRGLNIPAGMDLAYGIEESVQSPFSHLSFWHAAGRAGGWDSYREQLLQRLRAGQATEFRLQRRDLTTPATGLEPGLQGVVEGIRREVAASKELLLPASARETVRSLNFGLTTIPTTGDVLYSAGLSCATGMVGNWLSEGFTAAANALGWNCGTAGQLNEIITTLNTLQTEIGQIQLDITQSQFQQAVSSLQQSSIDPITVATQNIQNAVLSFPNNNGVFTANLPNVPATPSSTVQTMLNSVQSFNDQVELVDIQSALTGANGGTNLVLLGQNVTVTPYGIDQPSRFFAMPFRFNTLLNTCSQACYKYAFYQLEALNLLAEYSHNSADPSVGVLTGLNSMMPAYNSLKLQRQQLPLPLPSDQLIVDLEFGVMWYCGVNPPATFAAAADVADSYVLQAQLADGTVATYDDWRLPTYTELLALQYRGAYNPVRSSAVPTDSSGPAVPDFGQTTAGLVALGFQNVANAFNAANSEGSRNPGSDGDVWFQTWNANTNEPVSGYFFKLNEDGDYVGAATDTEAACYLLCRTLGTPVMNPYFQTNPSISNSNPTVSTAPPSVLPSPMVGQPLLPAEYLHYGSVFSLTAPTAANAPVTRPSPFPAAPAGALQLTCGATGQIQLGGTFVVGSGSNVSLTVQTGILTSPSPASTTLADGTPNGLGRLIAFVPQLYDATSSVVWNAPGLDGLLVFNGGTSVGVVAQCVGQTTSTCVTSPATPITIPSPLAGTVEAIAISPRNQIYSASNTSATYACTGFDSRDLVQSLAGSVTWSISPAGPTVSGGVVTLPPGTAAGNYTLTATLGNLTDSVLFQVNP